MINKNLMGDNWSSTIGNDIFALIKDLFPICRSITGNGVRDTLKIIKRHIPLEIHEVPSGTEVFDWTIPKEWNIRDAYLKGPDGETIVDYRQSNLHIVNYSIPINQSMPLSDLRSHLFSLPEHPDWIPYKTSYYREDWGFCLSHNQLVSLKDGKYEVFIESSLENGNLTYGECYIPGESQDEILISTHLCHPSLANDNLSGVALSTLLAKQLMPLKYSYRFVFVPGTIGAITWIYLNQGSLGRVKNGLVISGVGDAGEISYKRSRRGNAEIDRAFLQVIKDAGRTPRISDFDPYGYDERQYCSPGINLPVGRISRTPFNQYPEYHSSADNLDFVRPAYLGDSFNIIKSILSILEHNYAYMNLNPKCEPQLGKRGLYESMGDRERAILWVLNLSDGNHDLLDIAERSKVNFILIKDAARSLLTGGLLKRVPFLHN